MKNSIIIFLILVSLKGLAQNDYTYKVKKIDPNLPKLTLKITRVYQGENHGKIAIDFVHNAKDDSLNKKEFGRTDFYDYLDLVISDNNEFIYHLDKFELQNILYRKQLLRFSADTIQLTFKHVSSSLGYYEYYYEPIIFCSKKDEFFSNNFELKQDNNWRLVDRDFTKPYVGDYLDQGPLYSLNNYYLNTENGKIYKGSRLLRRIRPKKLFKNSRNYVELEKRKIYYSADGKRKANGQELIKKRKINIKKWNIQPKGGN